MTATLAYFATARTAAYRSRMYGYCPTTERQLVRQAIRTQRTTGCDTETAVAVVRAPEAPACAPLDAA